MSERKKILIKECKAEFLSNFLDWGSLWRSDKSNEDAYHKMARYACLVDLMTRLENSVKGNKS